jgi:hypothetical protein
LDMEKINFDLILALLKWIVGGDHEVKYKWPWSCVDNFWRLHDTQKLRKSALWVCNGNWLEGGIFSGSVGTLEFA